MNDPGNARFSTIVVCRLCLNRDRFALDIFSQLAESKEIQDKIRFCVPALKIFEDDALPKHVCFRCLYKLELTSDFIKQSILAENVLTKKSHAHEGEPLAKARKTNVFSSFGSSEPDANGVTKADSDDSFDDLDVHCFSNGFKESHLNSNRMSAQAYTHKKQERCTLYGFNGISEESETMIPFPKKSKKVVLSNWKDEGTHGKRAASTAIYSESCFDDSTSQFPQNFLHNNNFKSDTARNIRTNKPKGNRKTEEYLNMGDNEHNFLKDITQKSSPPQQNMASPIRFVHQLPSGSMHQLPSGSINQVDTQFDYDSDEEINQHMKILNSLRNKNLL